MGCCAIRILTGENKCQTVEALDLEYVVILPDEHPVFDCLIKILFQLLMV